jgi:microcystin-dependent protein
MPRILGVNHQVQSNEIQDGGIQPIDVAGSALVPTGTVLAFAGSSAPTGFLLCDGSSQLVASFTALQTVIGYTYGGGGANFNVPDLRGRVASGKDNMGGTPANRNNTQMAGSTLGAGGGEQEHTLLAGESGLPTHNVAGSTGGQSADHSHGLTYPNAPGGVTQIQIVAGNGTTVPMAAVTTGSSNDHGHSFNVAVGSSIASGPHNNMQPTLVLNYIIKT